MKLRQGFISNSSSSSFIINKKYLSHWQTEQIKSWRTVGKELGLEYTTINSNGFDWEIEETDREILGATWMDNFDMYEYMILLQIDMGHVHWEDENHAKRYIRDEKIDELRNKVKLIKIKGKK